MLVKRKLKKPSLKPRKPTKVRKVLNRLNSAYRYINPWYKTITVDLTEEERATFEALAEENGMNRHEYCQYALEKVISGAKTGLYYDKEV